jgi:dihydrodipicolinate synthase/N-acetylneuraminate lyase
VHGLALPLHTGESLNLTSAERRSLVECAVSAAGGRVPVLAHVSLPGTDQVIELAQHCRDGEIGRARPLQYRASALWHLLRETGYPAS